MPLNETLFKNRGASQHAQAIRRWSGNIDRNTLGYEQGKYELLAAAKFLEELNHS